MTSTQVQAQGRDESETGSIEINRLGDMVELYAHSEQDGTYVDLVLSRTETIELIAALSATLVDIDENDEEE